MGLITVAEAAKRLGIHRQTIESWAQRGFLKMRKTGVNGNSLWVDADTIDQLKDVAADVEHAKRMLEKERKEIEVESKGLQQRLRDIRRSVFLTKKYESGVYVRDFYTSIPKMLSALGIITERECDVTVAVIEGRSTIDIAEEFGVTSSRIVQIFSKTCRKALLLKDIKERLDEADKLKLENTEMENVIYSLKDELERYHKDDELLSCHTEEEQRAIIEEMDRLCGLLSSSIENLGFTRRTMNCLHSFDIMTVGDLVRLTREKLLKIRNFGMKSFIELDDFLETCNLNWGMDVDKIYKERVNLRLAMKRVGSKDAM